MTPGANASRTVCLRHISCLKKSLPWPSNPLTLTLTLTLSHTNLGEVTQCPHGRHFDLDPFEIVKECPAVSMNALRRLTWTDLYDLS